MTLKELLKLLGGLALIAGAVAIALLLIRAEGDPTKKYSHPITRPGARW